LSPPPERSRVSLHLKPANSGNPPALPDHQSREQKQKNKKEQKMKTTILGNLAAEAQRSLLVGTFQGYELKQFASGSAVEQFSLLVGKRVIDVSIFVPKGTDVKTIKPPGWAPGAKAVAVDVSIESGEYGLQARAKSVNVIEN
jgi:hypothetical protein